MTKIKENTKKITCKDCIYGKENFFCDLFNIKFDEITFNKNEFCRNFEEKQEELTEEFILRSYENGK